MKLALCSLTAVLVLSGTAFADDILCADKSGKLTLRTTCKKNERQISFDRPGPQGPKGDEGPRGFQGPIGPKGVPGDGAATVYDSVGVRVGTLVNIGCDDGPSNAERAWVVTEFSGDPHLACVGKDGFIPRFDFYYDGVNCTGNAYVDEGVYNYSKRSELLPRALINVRREAFDVEATKVDVSIRSRWLGGGSEGCQTWETPASLFPATLLGSTTQLFSSPFSVRGPIP